MTKKRMTAADIKRREKSLDRCQARVTAEMKKVLDPIKFRMMEEVAVSIMVTEFFITNHKRYIAKDKLKPALKALKKRLKALKKINFNIGEGGKA